MPCPQLRDLLNDMMSFSTDNGGLLSLLAEMIADPPEPGATTEQRIEWGNRAWAVFHAIEGNTKQCDTCMEEAWEVYRRLKAAAPKPR